MLPSELHVGRHWPSEYGKRGTLEEECPCPTEPCGMIAESKIDPECPQHSMKAGRTIRASHYAVDCPGEP